MFISILLSTVWQCSICFYLSIPIRWEHKQNRIRIVWLAETKEKPVKTHQRKFHFILRKHRKKFAFIEFFQFYSLYFYFLLFFIYYSTSGRYEHTFESISKHKYIVQLSFICF